MSRYYFVLLIILIPFSSCNSLGQNKPHSETIIPKPKTSGNISSFEIVDNQLILWSDGVIRIAYALNTINSISQLKNAESYIYSHLRKPDGPISTLKLNKEEESFVWIFEGLREGGVLQELSISQSEGIDSIILKSPNKEWVVPADTETVVNWGEGDYIAYVSQISKGQLEDQPPFRCNLILLKK